MNHDQRSLQDRIRARLEYGVAGATNRGLMREAAARIDALETKIDELYTIILRLTSPGGY